MMPMVLAEIPLIDGGVRLECAIDRLTDSLSER